jgi:hypothetical protein
MIIESEYEQSKNIMENLMLNIIQQVGAGEIKWN